jgi:hypothetical protein
MIRYLITVALFAHGAGHFLTHQEWWPQLALASAAISLAMIVLGGVV